MSKKEDKLIADIATLINRNSGIPELQASVEEDSDSAAILMIDTSEHTQVMIKGSVGSALRLLIVAILKDEDIYNLFKGALEVTDTIKSDTGPLAKLLKKTLGGGEKTEEMANVDVSQRAIESFMNKLLGK